MECLNCGKPIDNNKFYCSVACRLLYHEKTGTTKCPTVKRTCKFCGKEFITKSSNRIYCNLKCRRQAELLRPRRPSEKRRKRIIKPIEKICPNCGKTFATIRYNQVYCDKYCKKEFDYKANQALKSEKKTIEPVKKPAKNAEPTSNLDTLINEAEACGMSYGQYKAQIKFFGKTFEELKAAYERRCAN